MLLNSNSANFAGRSDWDDGRREWEETPHRDGHSRTNRHHHPSPSPMLVGASPDARLVSPWLGGQTPHSTGTFNLFHYIELHACKIETGYNSILILVLAK